MTLGLVFKLIKNIKLIKIFQNNYKEDIKILYQLLYQSIKDVHCTEKNFYFVSRKKFLKHTVSASWKYLNVQFYFVTIKNIETFCQTFYLIEETYIE